MQGQIKQCGLNHRVTLTTNSYMGGTMNIMATDIYINGPQFILRDKVQLVLIISRTNYPKMPFLLVTKLIL